MTDTTDTAQSPTDDVRTGDTNPTTTDAAVAAVNRKNSVRIPNGDHPYVCTYCNDPFKRERHLALHRGLAHYGDLTDGERTAFDEAYTDEDAEIRRFRIVALGALVLLYFAFLFAYALFAL